MEREIKMGIVIAKEAFNAITLNKQAKYWTQEEKLVSWNVWRIALYGSVTWTLRKLERKYLQSFEMWYWRRMEKIKWLEKVSNEEVLERTGEKRTLLNNILRWKVKSYSKKKLASSWYHWGQMTKVKGGRRRRRKQLLDDLRNRRRYWELKEEAEERKRWRWQFINLT